MSEKLYSVNFSFKLLVVKKSWMPVRTKDICVMEPSSTLGVALDLILKTLIASQDFTNLQTKNWDAIARLIPGSTPGQVTYNAK